MGEQYPISSSDHGKTIGISYPNTSSTLRLSVNSYIPQILLKGITVRSVRTKNKGVFPSDTALEKLVYLAYRNIRKKWTMPLANWATISQQLAIKFGERFKLL